jgi:hypothetical protein
MAITSSLAMEPMQALPVPADQIPEDLPRRSWTGYGPWRFPLGDRREAAIVHLRSGVVGRRRPEMACKTRARYLSRRARGKG